MSRLQRGGAVAATAIVLALPAAGQDNAQLARGEYLVNGPAACSNCHGTRAADFSIPAGMEFAGGFHIADPAVDAYAANITPDPETGIGNWTDEQIATAIRQGVDPEGHIIFPPMPVPTYNGMSDDDVNAIVAYLRTLPPVKHEVPDSTYNIPQQAMPPAAGAPAPDPADQVAYGGYLVNAVAHCFECHTPMTATGPDMARLGAGGMEITLGPDMVIRTSNITPDVETGIGGWSDDDVKVAITDGLRPGGGQVSPPMPYPWFKNMTEQDVDAIVAYLRTVPAVSNKVERTPFQMKAFP